MNENYDYFVDVKKVSVNPKQTQYVELIFSPKVSGEFSITGIEFKWCNVVLQAVFDHPPVQINAFKESPFLDVIKPNLDLTNIKENDIFQIKLSLENKGNQQLKHLSFQTYGDSQIKLIEPYEREFTGFRFLKALLPGEKYTVRVSIKAKEGSHDLGILLPYWAHEGPPRYTHFYIKYDATKSDEFQVLQRSCSVHINTNEYIPLGITSPAFPCAPHTHIDIEHHKAILYLVTNEYQEDSEFKIPDFCKPFGDDGLRVWCKKGKDMYTSQFITDLEAPVAILIKHIANDKYQANVTNIGKVTVHNARFSFLEPDENVTFIISGIELRIIDQIPPGETSSFSFSLVFFDGYNRKRPPKIMIAAEEFLAVSDLYL